MKNAELAHQFNYMVMSFLTVTLWLGFERPTRYAEPLGHPQKPQNKQEVDRLCTAEIDGLFDDAADDVPPDTPLFNRICGQQNRRNSRRAHTPSRSCPGQLGTDSDDDLAPPVYPSGITGGMHHGDPVQTPATNIPSSCPGTPGGCCAGSFIRSPPGSRRTPTKSVT